MRRWIDRHATIGFAASRQAAAALFGPDWGTEPRWGLLYCSVDLSPFQSDPDAGEVGTALVSQPMLSLSGTSAILPAKES